MKTSLTGIGPFDSYGGCYNCIFFSNSRNLALMLYYLVCLKHIQPHLPTLLGPSNSFPRFHHFGLNSRLIPEVTGCGDIHWISKTLDFSYKSDSWENIASVSLCPTKYSHVFPLQYRKTKRRICMVDGGLHDLSEQYISHFDKRGPLLHYSCYFSFFIWHSLMFYFISMFSVYRTWWPSIINARIKSEDMVLSYDFKLPLTSACIKQQ